MGLHSRAWQGFNLLILGETPLLAMQIEQAIALASPANEIKIDSFENFEDAYEFCKKTQTVGFILLEDTLGKIPISDAFKQLSRFYDTTGWPCFGALFHNKGETFAGHRAMQISPTLLDYFPAQALLDSGLIFEQMRSLWKKYTEEIERLILPNVLKESIFELTQRSMSESERILRERLLNLVTANLDLSWLEMLGLKWAPVIAALDTANPGFSATLSTLHKMSAIAPLDPGLRNLESLANSKASLVVRTRALVEVIAKAAAKGELTTLLNESKKIGKPGSPALIRHVANNATRIAEVCAETLTEKPTRRSG